MSTKPIKWDILIAYISFVILVMISFVYEPSYLSKPQMENNGIFTLEIIDSTLVDMGSYESTIEDIIGK